MNLQVRLWSAEGDNSERLCALACALRPVALVTCYTAYLVAIPMYQASKEKRRKPTLQAKKALKALRFSYFWIDITDGLMLI